MKHFFDFYFKNVSFKIAISTIAIFLGLLIYLPERVSESLYLIDFKNQVVIFTAPLFWFLVLNISIIFISDFNNKKIRQIRIKRAVINMFKKSNSEELGIIYGFYDKQQRHFLSTKLLAGNNGSVMLMRQNGLLFTTSSIMELNPMTGGHMNTYSLNRILLNYLNDNKVDVLHKYFEL